MLKLPYGPLLRKGRREIGGGRAGCHLPGQGWGWSWFSRSPCGKKKAGSQYLAGNPPKKLLSLSVGRLGSGCRDGIERFQAVISLIYLSEGRPQGGVVNGLVSAQAPMMGQCPPPLLASSFPFHLQPSPTREPCPGLDWNPATALKLRRPSSRRWQ